MSALPWVLPFMGFLLAPFFRSIINRTKALVGGRQGPPWLQPYYDLAKLLRKGAVYSTTTTWVFRAAPVVSFSAVVTAQFLVPYGDIPAALHFSQDILLFIALLAISRMFMTLAALDTGSPFEGMGANRELLFSAFAEPVILMSLATLARDSTTLSLTGIYIRQASDMWEHVPAVLMLVVVAMFIVLLAENSRIPVDDPTTHLELTMIHEVIVLDHGGPDLALIEYAHAIKLWTFSTLVVGLLLPTLGWNWSVNVLVMTVCMALLAVVIGAVESSMARLRMPNVPHFLMSAGVLATLAMLLEVFRP